MILSNNPKTEFKNREVFADLEHTPIGRRSGHLGHAMAECKDGSILAFYSNCSAMHGGNYYGHTMYGWVEYKRSTDRGLTWSEPKVLDYSYKCFLDGVYKIGCEKAVVCDDGTVVLFCLRSIGYSFEPYATPVCSDRVRVKGFRRNLERAYRSSQRARQNLRCHIPQRPCLCAGILQFHR